MVRGICLQSKLEHLRRDSSNDQRPRYETAEVFEMPQLSTTNTFQITICRGFHHKMQKLWSLESDLQVKWIMMRKKLSTDDFKKLLELLRVDGPPVQYKNPDAWRGAFYRI